MPPPHGTGMPTQTQTGRVMCPPTKKFRLAHQYMDMQGKRVWARRAVRAVRELRFCIWLV